MTKRISLRNFVLMKNRPRGFYQGEEIVDCGLMGIPNKYWIRVLCKCCATARDITNLDRIEQVKCYF